MKILVTGATGYIGGRLIPRLLQRGHEVRILVRDPERIAGRPWAAQVDIRTGDLLDENSLAGACEGIEAAYYLVHSMGAGNDFKRLDKSAAENFCRLAGDIGHVIYLGGVLPASPNVSDHLGSRAQVGEILRENLKATEFRAGPIIGSGSASFEMIRYLTERLPFMIAPKWVHTKVQPIAVRDMLAYLLDALDHAPLGVVNVGTTPMRFIDMMRQYAEIRGLKRRIIPVPVLAPKLAALWVGLVTPITNRLAVPLVEGMVQDLVVDTSKASELFPELKPIDYQTAVTLALDIVDRDAVETRWSGALGDAETYDVTDWEGVIRETRSLQTTASPEQCFLSFSSLGGTRGWRAWNGAWKARGLLDQLVGGPGLRRGRRHPTELFTGESLDFWRVAEIQYPRKLKLRAEMKVPGKAWLQWEALPEGSGTRLVQTAIFEPHGFWGLAYWKLLYPLHRLIFSDMARAVEKDARLLTSDSKHTER